MDNWTQQSDGNYSAKANNDTTTATATTAARTNERGEACYGLTVQVATGGAATDYTAPGTFYKASDWGALAEMYCQRAISGESLTPLGGFRPRRWCRRI